LRKKGDTIQKGKKERKGKTAGIRREKEKRKDAERERDKRERGKIQKGRVMRKKA
jgi:hypothetical protein